MHSTWENGLEFIGDHGHYADCSLHHISSESHADVGVIPCRNQKLEYQKWSSLDQKYTKILFFCIK